MQGANNQGLSVDTHPPEPDFQPFFDELDAATPRVFVVPALIAINVFVFLTMGFAGIGWIVPAAESTIPWGVDYWPLTTSGEWWRLLTSAFVHFGIFHIAFNMWALYAAGRLTEQLFGNVFFLLIYLVTAVLSGLTSIWFTHVAVAAGASGAIFAIYGALLAYVLFQRAALPRDVMRNLLRSTLGFVVLNIGLGLRVNGISNGAHIGGLVTGFILGAVFARLLELNRRRQQMIPKLLAGTALSAAMIVAGLAFVPRVSPTEATAVRFGLALRTLAPLQHEADARYRSLSDRHLAGQLSDTDFADRLDRDIAPAWTTIFDRLNKIPADPNSSEHIQFEFPLKVARINRDLAIAQAAYLRHPNPQTAKAYLELQSDQNMLHKQRQEDRDEEDQDMDNP